MNSIAEKLVRLALKIGFVDQEPITRSLHTSCTL